MEELATLVDWSRAQLALTAIYHYLFVPLTLGLSFIIAIMETVFVISGDEFYKKMVKFWMKLFGINFVISIATGLVLVFELGTNWGNYSYMVGDVIGSPLLIGGLFAFLVETAFFAVMYYGWDKVGKISHLTVTWFVAIVAGISALCILVVNAWMEYPTGMIFNPETARYELLDFWELFSFVALSKYFHTLASAFVLSALFVIGISSWYLMKNREKTFAKKSIKLAAWFGLLGTVGAFGTGYLSSQIISIIQPIKFAAIENLHHGQKNAPFSIVPGVEVKGALSFIANGDANSFVPGMEDIVNGYTDYSYGKPQFHMDFDSKKDIGNLGIGDFNDCQYALKNMKPKSAAKKKTEVMTKDFIRNLGRYVGYAYVEDPHDIVPPVMPVFWSFRIMVVFGVWFLLSIVIWLWSSYKPLSVTEKKWWLKMSVATIFMVYLAFECGWIVSEVGNQPWMVQGLLPANLSVSNLPINSVIVTFVIFIVLYTILLCANISIMRKQIVQGPDTNC